MLEQKITFDKFIRWTITTLIIAFTIYLVNYLSSVLLPFFVAWLLAYLVHPIVMFVQFRLHVPTRVLSILVTLIFLIAVLGGVSFLIFPPMIDQFDKLGQIIMKYLRETTHVRNFPELIQVWITSNAENIEKFFKNPDVIDTIKSTMPQFFSFIGQTANIVISIIASFITLLYMFFILLDYEYLSNNWVKIFPKKNRPFWNELMSDVKRELSKYIRGQGLVSLIMGILFCIGFTIIGFPMAIGLGILVGVMNLVPYLHTLALIPTAFLALLKAADTGQNFWVILGSAIAVFCIVQIIIEMFVNPKIMGKAMGLNPAILLLSLSVWGALLGFIGLIIALPLTTILMAYWQRYVTHEHLNEVSGTVDTPTDTPKLPEA